LAAFDLTLAPTERFGALVMLLDKSRDGLAQIVLAFEAGTAERLALQQTENDFDLVQPTGGRRREVKPDAAFKLG
jgi:hypothetical protein